MCCSRVASRLSRSDRLEQFEKAPFATRVDGPVDRHQLETIHIVTGRGATADAFTRVEKAPGCMSANRRDEVIHRLLEGEVVVLVEYDWLTAVRRRGARPVDLLCNEPWIGGAIAMQQHEVCHLQ